MPQTKHTQINSDSQLNNNDMNLGTKYSERPEDYIDVLKMRCAK